ncbi:MAG: TrpR-like protein [Microgenomates group bacterium GW2011_GWF2_47_9]|nr:MAG: TrpR-like protein [Microgenomates group bacterium GW2011_GWF2_47_9]
MRGVMQKSSSKMSKNIESQVYKILYQVIADSKNEVEAEILLKSLLTESELSALAKRLAIAVFLDKGQSYDKIKDILKVSSATIASVALNVNSKGMQTAIARIKAGEWADVWSIKISRALEKLMK